MRLAITLLMGTLAAASTLDRIDLVIGRRIITELQLEEEMQVTAFLNEGTASGNIRERRAAAHRMLEQTLIGREMELAHFPQPEPAAIAGALASIREQYRSDEAFNSALASHHITLQIVEEHLSRQISMLRFIEYRFRPQLVISDSDLQAGYKRYMAEWKATHAAGVLPSFDEVKAEIRTRISEARTDAALDSWIAESRRQISVIYLDPTLEAPAAGAEKKQ